MMSGKANCGAAEDSRVRSTTYQRERHLVCSLVNWGFIVDSLTSWVCRGKTTGKKS